MASFNNIPLSNSAMNIMIVYPYGNSSYSHQGDMTYVHSYFYEISGVITCLFRLIKLHMGFAYTALHDKKNECHMKLFTAVF